MIRSTNHLCRRDDPVGLRRWRLRTALSGVAVVLLLCYTVTADEQRFGEWGPPANLDVVSDPTRGINTSSNDGCPIESPDGQAIFLASNRTGTLGLNDIWVATRSSDGGSWSQPENLEPVNSAANDFCPTPLPGNRLMFVSTRANNCGGVGNNADIYFTRLHPVRGWLEPQPLSCDVNSGFDEFSPSVVETDGRTLLFFSSNRGDGVRHKIYMSVLGPDGAWEAASPVDELNDPSGSDARPNVRKDGLEIVFDSTRGAMPPQIYSATRSSTLDLWSLPQPVASILNPLSQHTRPSLSRDGTRLYFGSNRPGGEGSADIYVASRSGPGFERPR